MTKRHWRFLLGLVFACGLLAWLLAGLDRSAPSAAAARVPISVWCAAAVGVLLSHLLRALRLRAEWRPRVGAELGACLRLALLHNAAVLLLPMAKAAVPARVPPVMVPARFSAVRPVLLRFQVLPALFRAPVR